MKIKFINSSRKLCNINWEPISHPTKEEANKMVSISNKIVKLERKKKMPIKIFTEKYIVNGKRCRGIISVQGVFSKSELPLEYIIGDLPAFYWNEAYKISKNNEIRNVFLLYYKNEIPLLGSSSLGSPLLEEKTYPEKEFQQILSYIRKAGENLQRINQKLKLEQWKGKEEFII